MRYLLVRIRIPNGLLTAAQTRRIADLAERYARGVADITVRQNIQLHWVRIEDLPAVIQGLSEVGISTLGSCGDVTRNVTGSPVAGVDADEIVDARPLVQAATAMLNGRPAFHNLPRKFKVSITGCRVWCSYPEINDVGLTAVRHPYSGRTGFSVRVGGGLSTDPHPSRRLDAFVPWEQALAVVKGIGEIFRDTDVLRQSRENARLKFLFLQHGWTAERFKNALERRLGEMLEPAVPELAPEDVYRDHVGIHLQKQVGLAYVGIAVLRGRLTSGQLRAAAYLAERYGSGDVRATGMQNLLVLDVPRSLADELAREIEALGLRIDASPFWRGSIARTGSEFCKIALTETKSFARSLVSDLEARLPGFEEHLKIHVTGCPSSCGQHWIADLGLEGKKVKVDGRLVDAYYFCVGGAVGAHQAVARPVGYRVAASQVPEAIERLLRAYLAERGAGENFRQYCAAHTDEELRNILAGDLVEAVARDVAQARPPPTASTAELHNRQGPQALSPPDAPAEMSQYYPVALDLRDPPASW